MPNEESRRLQDQKNRTTDEAHRLEDNESRMENTKALVANTLSNETPDTAMELIVAVQNLTTVVGTLTETMESYPNRAEIQRDYASRNEIRRRRWQISAAMVGAIIASYFFTIGSISYCFLGGVPEDSAKAACNVFPGYRESFDNNKELITIFENLQIEIERNRTEIDQLNGTVFPK